MVFRGDLNEVYQGEGGFSKGEQIEHIISREDASQARLEEYYARKKLCSLQEAAVCSLYSREGSEQESSVSKQEASNKIYMKAVSKFADAQKERQHANLSSNTGKADTAADARQVLEHHDAAVSYIQDI